MTTGVIKAFVDGLKQHLANNRSNYGSYVSGPGGCETCGYGAPEHFDVDIEQLEAEIDAFAATFNKA